MTDSKPLLRLFQSTFERIGMDPQVASRSAMALLFDLGEVPIPSPREIQQLRQDQRALELTKQGMPPAVVAFRLGCDMSTVYRRMNRALDLKRTA